MTNIKKLVLSSKLNEASKLISKSSVEELSEIVEYFKGLEVEEMQALMDNVNEQIKQKQAERKTIEQEAIDLNKQRIEKTINENIATIEEKKKQMNLLESKFASELEEVKEKNSRPCECGKGKMVLRRSARGEFLGCNQFPNCKKTSNDIAKLSADAEDARSEYSFLSSEVYNLERYNKNNDLSKPVKPVYTKETADKANAISDEISSLRRTLQDYKNILSGQGNMFEQGLKIAMKNAQMKPYLEAFDRKPYMKNDMLIENFETLKKIESEIKRRLADNENFEGIDFCDVSAGGIQVRGFNKQVKGYSYGGQPTIKYDFSNVNEVIEEFVQMWLATDNPEQIKSLNNFVEQGEKYGWD